MIKPYGYNSNTPKNYSRKNYICSCKVEIIYGKKVQDMIDLKYSIKPLPSSGIKFSKNKHNEYWGGV